VPSGGCPFGVLDGDHKSQNSLGGDSLVRVLDEIDSDSTEHRPGERRRRPPTEPATDRPGRSTVPTDWFLYAFVSRYGVGTRH
jgi:hypothetical protein